MAAKVSAIWNCDPRDMQCSLEKCLNESLEKTERVRVFFRADDIAAPSRNYTNLMGVFRENRVPLCLAVVPSWISKTRWEAIAKTAGGDSSQWCWHQHGWRHINHESVGKKQEFGPSRSREDISRDLQLGRHRLEAIIGKAFEPYFTPPWNRCGPHTLEVLQELEYRAISRSIGAKPISNNLPEYFVNVDLHTRRQGDGSKDMEAFFSELSQALAGGYCGIMIHHQLMNSQAFDFLDVLLQVFSKQKKLDLVSLNAFE